MSHKILKPTIFTFLPKLHLGKNSYCFLLLLFCILFHGTANAQSRDNYNVNSPYSRIGFGNIAPEGSIRNLGMGGTGVSQSNGRFLNMINPALLINNRVHRYDSLTTILDGALTAELRNISDQNSSLLSGTSNFYSFTYAFPIHKRWVTAIGLRPYSNVSYSINVNSPIAGTNETAQVIYQGKGGINRAEFANAYKLSRNIHLGFSASYLFGSVQNYSFSVLNNQPDSNYVGSNQNLAYKGFLLRPGLTYRTAVIDKGQDSSVFVNVGLAYDWFLNTKVRDEFFIERRNYVNQVISRITNEAVTQSVTFPSVIRSGISFDKGSKWNVAMDFTYYMASKFKGANSRDTLRNGFTIAVGGELELGDYKNVEGLLKSKYIRSGFSYTKSPIAVNGKQLNEVAVYFGYSFPVGSKKIALAYKLPRPQINMAIIAGQIGGTDNNMIKEQYLKGFIGFTINDKWFKKRRVD